MQWTRELHSSDVSGHPPHSSLNGLEPIEFHPHPLSD